MEADEVLKEVQAVKDSIAAEYQYDIRKLVQALMRMQTDRGHKLISRKSRPVAG